MARKVSEGVGKKIVEALKKQSEIEITPVSARSEEDIDDVFSGIEENFDDNTIENDDIFADEAEIHNDENDLHSEIEQEEPINLDALASQSYSKPFASYQQPAQPIQESFMKELDNFEIPGNIAVLKKLITQLPTGVSKHTGAQIIKQTMEALGISMKSVLQEAQQVQDGLNNSAKECFSSVQEYKKQISILEKQAQNYQRQYLAMNELISLFVQTGI